MVALNELPVAAEPALVITRIFAAPPALVFAAWTDPAHLGKWSCPHGFVISHCESDPRVGGTWKTCMRSPQGVDHWAAGTYRELKPHRKIVFTREWLSPEPMANHLTLVTIALEEIAPGKTRMSFHQATFKTAASRDGHRGGWTEAFERLEEYLAGAAKTCS